MKLARESKISLVVVTACYVLLGLVLLFCPQFTVNMLCYAIGGICVVYGVSRVVAYCLRQVNWDEPYRFDLVVGLVFAGAGVYAIVQSQVVAGMLSTVVGLAVCLDSLVKLQTAIDLKRLGSRVWVSVLLLALVTGTLGGLVFWYQGTGLLSMLQFVGLCLVLDGCVNIWSFTFLGMNLARLRKAHQKDATADTADDTDRADAATEGLRGNILSALGALKKKKNAPDTAPAAPTTEEDAARFEQPAQAAVVLLKPTSEELGNAPAADAHGAPDAPDAPNALDVHAADAASATGAAPSAATAQRDTARSE